MVSIARSYWPGECMSNFLACLSGQDSWLTDSNDCKVEGLASRIRKRQHIHELNFLWAYLRQTKVGEVNGDSERIKGPKVSVRLSSIKNLGSYCFGVISVIILEWSINSELP